jgi:hypothetical protein
MRGLSRQKIRVLFTMELTDCYAKRFVSEQRTITLHQRDINAEKRYGVNVGQGLGLYVDAGGPIRAAPERHIFSNHTQPSSLHFGVPQLRKLDQRGAVVHFLPSKQLRLLRDVHLNKKPARVHVGDVLTSGTPYPGFGLNTFSLSDDAAALVRIRILFMPLLSFCP